MGTRNTCKVAAVINIYLKFALCENPRASKKNRRSSSSPPARGCSTLPAELERRMRRSAAVFFAIVAACLAEGASCHVQVFFVSRSPAVRLCSCHAGCGVICECF